LQFCNHQISFYIDHFCIYPFISCIFARNAPGFLAKTEGVLIFIVVFVQRTYVFEARFSTFTRSLLPSKNGRNRPPQADPRCRRGIVFAG
jgi:hypothetical protein